MHIKSIHTHTQKKHTKSMLCIIWPTQPSGQQHQTLIIEEFEPDVFRQLIEYIHTGCVTLQPRTLLGKSIT